MIYSRGINVQDVLTTARAFEYARWDTGHGFNQWQEVKAPDFELRFFLPNETEVFRAVHVGKFVFLKRLEICFREHGQHVYLDYGTTAPLVPVAQSPDGLCQSFSEAQLVKPPYFREAAEWTLFFLGVSIFSGILTAWFFFFLRAHQTRNRNERRLFLALGAFTCAGIALAAWIFFPGFVNPYEPSFILVKDAILPRYSSLLSLLWLAVYEVFPAPWPYLFGLSLFQLFAFSIAFLHLMRLLYQKCAAPGWLILGVVAFVTFMPVGIASQFFLVRGNSVSLVHFLLLGWVFAWLLLARAAPRNAQWMVAGSSVVLVLLRLDYIPIVALLFGILYFREKRRAFLGMIALGVAAAFAIFSLAESRLQAKEKWQSTYLHRQARLLFIDLARDHLLEQRCGFSAVKEGSHDPAPVKKALACAWENRAEVWRNRQEEISTLLNTLPIWFDANNLFREWESNFLLAQMRQRFWNSEDEANTLGPYRFTSAFAHPALTFFRLKFPILMVCLSVLLLPWFPFAGILSALVFLRVALLFAVGPFLVFHYFLDIYLWGMFVPFAMAVELFSSRAKKRARSA